MNKLLVIVVVGFALLLSACNSDALFTSLRDPGVPTSGDNPGTNPPASSCYDQKHIQVETTSKKLDLLFVIDTSGSMDEEAKRISAQMDALMTAILNGFDKVDYRIAVLLGHAVGPQSGVFWNPSTCEQRGDPKVISGNELSTLSNILSQITCKFSSLAKSTGGDAGEAVFVSYSKAIGPNLGTNQTDGFFRENAALATVFITDENEICNWPEGIANGQPGEESFRKSVACNGMTAQNIYSTTSSLMGVRPFIFAGMAETRVNLAPGVESFSYGILGWPDDAPIVPGAVYPQGIVKLAGNSGFYSDIHNSNEQIAMDLDEMGKVFVQNIALLTKFKLEKPNYVPKSVSVAGKAVPFKYLSLTSEVEISPLVAGKDGDEILINACLPN